MEKIKKTEDFTDLGWKTTAVLAQNGYHIETAVLAGRMVAKFGETLVGNEYFGEYSTIRFTSGKTVFDVKVSFENETMIAYCCVAHEGEKEIVIFPSLEC